MEKLIYYLGDSLREVLSFTKKDRSTKTNVKQWEGEPKLIEALETGRPVVMVDCLPGHKGCNQLKPFYDKISKTYPAIHFFWINCAKYENWCASRRPRDLPWIEVFQKKQDEKEPTTTKEQPEEEDRSFVDVKLFDKDFTSELGWKVFLSQNYDKYV